jgi:hypothetical protein
MRLWIECADESTSTPAIPEYAPFATLLSRGAQVLL